MLKLEKCGANDDVVIHDDDHIVDGDDGGVEKCGVNEIPFDDCDTNFCCFFAMMR